ncbi:MAG TPA: hypothetical protein VMW77_06160 [Methanoregula sp.]|nr:hypothetical protein [Methanoregula sp.]
MSRLRTLLEWTVILILFFVIGFLVYDFTFGAALRSSPASGLPDGTGGFYQTPLSSQQQFTKNAGDWSFSLSSGYSYILAGKIVARKEYPATMPDGISPIDLAVVNGDLLKPYMLSYFKITTGDRTLEYSYDIPTFIGLTEEYIDEHISNNHLVFLDPALENEVKKAEVGTCLIIEGKLVDIRGTSPNKKYLADTSTVRNDTYPAGCEVILVESFKPVSCGDPGPSR